MNIEKATENLRTHGFEVSVFDTKEQAADYLVESIKDTTVGIGGSMTMEDLDVADRLKAQNTLFWHQIDNSPEVSKEANRAKVYITSANGVSETGEIINIDGRGNRVSATLYEKDAVYFVVGENKFAPTFDEALFRARNISAPKNAKRLNKKTPCAGAGDKCYDCDSPERICRGLVVNWRPMFGVKKTEVIIIKEELGF